MSFDFLAKISERVVRQWKRGDLNKKFVEMAKDLLVSKEKVLQFSKKIAELEDENRRLKAEQARPKFKPKKKIDTKTTDEAESKSKNTSPKSKKEV